MKKIFLDCGAYTGCSVKKFTPVFKGFEIYSFEPNPLLAQFHDPLPNTLIQAAVWVENGAIDFYLDQKDYDGSSIYSHKKQIINKKKITVPCLDFSSWLSAHCNPDDFIILKMDIEGAEYEVLPKMIRDGTIQLVNELLIEFHWDKIRLDQTVHEQLVQELADQQIPLHDWDGILPDTSALESIKRRYSFL